MRAHAHAYLRSMPCLKCLVLVIGVSGYSDDIAISSWTLSRYHDQQKIYDSSPNHEIFQLFCRSVDLVKSAKTEHRYQKFVLKLDVMV